MVTEDNPPPETAPPMPAGMDPMHEKHLREVWYAGIRLLKEVLKATENDPKLRAKWLGALTSGDLSGEELAPLREIAERIDAGNVPITRRDWAITAGVHALEWMGGNAGGSVFGEVLQGKSVSDLGKKIENELPADPSKPVVLGVLSRLAPRSDLLTLMAKMLFANATMFIGLTASIKTAKASLLRQRAKPGVTEVADMYHVAGTVAAALAESEDAQAMEASITQRWPAAAKVLGNIADLPNAERQSCIDALFAAYREALAWQKKQTLGYGLKEHSRHFCKLLKQQVGGDDLLQMLQAAGQEEAGERCDKHNQAKIATPSKTLLLIFQMLGGAMYALSQSSGALQDQLTKAKEECTTLMRKNNADPKFEKQVLEAIDQHIALETPSVFYGIFALASAASLTADFWLWPEVVKSTAKTPYIAPDEFWDMMDILNTVCMVQQVDPQAATHAEIVRQRRTHLRSGLDRSDESPDLML